MAIHGSSRGRGHVWLILLAVLGAALVSLLALARWDSAARAIVGGTPVPDGSCGKYSCASKYNFIADLAVFPKKGDFKDCGGTLIDPDSVLTAAHCVVNAEDVNVIVGLADEASTKPPPSYTWIQSSVAVFSHPRYKTIGRSELYDAAVIKLEEPVKLIKPIGLATAQQNKLETPGYKLTVAG